MVIPNCCWAEPPIDPRLDPAAFIAISVVGNTTKGNSTSNGYFASIVANEFHRQL